MKYPKSIKIGYNDYAVVEVPAGNIPGCDGHIEHNPPQITVADDMLPGRAANVLLHEIMHGIYDLHSMDEGSVNTFANGLCVVIRDNPGFAAWLAEHLEK